MAKRSKVARADCSSDEPSLAQKFCGGADLRPKPTTLPPPPPLYHSTHPTGDDMAPRPP